MFSKCIKRMTVQVNTASWIFLCPSNQTKGATKGEFLYDGTNMI